MDDRMKEDTMTALLRLLNSFSLTPVATHASPKPSMLKSLWAFQ
jgi:hypothetical protein